MNTSVPFSPLRLVPRFRSYLWGGNRLSQRLGKAVPGDGNWAESWEVVDRDNDQSVVAEGPWQGRTLRQLIESQPEAILGTATSLKHFPLLLKYLDCNQVLSVQVHPNDRQASQLPKPDLGKTEAWYVIHAEPGAKIYAGLKPGVDRQILTECIAQQRTEECLHVLEPIHGQCVFIPAGTVHALGAGLLVAEIQQSSDTTFRLFDWNRVDPEGKPRPLHIDQALDVIDFDRGPIGFCRPQPLDGGAAELLVSCDKFTLLRYHTGVHRLDPRGRFQILTVPEGIATVRHEMQEWRLDKGQTMLVPAQHPAIDIQIQPRTSMLVAHLP